MKLEQQVCSLKLARRLKELGVKQDSLHSWWHKWEGSSDDDAGRDILTLTQNTNTMFVASAFTVAELGEILPISIATGDVNNMLFTDRFNTKWLVGYANMREDDINFSDTEADARAEALIWLIQNNLLTV